MNIDQRSQLIKSKSQSLGFSYCGISKAEFLENQAPKLETWLKNNMHGQMEYMANHFDKRLDPRLLVDDSRSVISLLYNYFPEKQLDTPFKISKYAYGEDYHYVIKNKLKQLVHELQEQLGDFDGRAFVDSAPVMDKVWAEKAGLGWIGKNSNLINKRSGSFFFIAELIVDLDLAYDSPIKDYCGTCTKCIDACPTDAIISPYVVDGSKCISYFTIELKEAIPQELKGQFENWAFGCDICQDVCPWNRFSTPHDEPSFLPNQDLLNLSSNDWQDLSLEVFNKAFKGSAIKRTKFEGFTRNLKFLQQN